LRFTINERLTTIEAPRAYTRGFFLLASARRKPRRSGIPFAISTYGETLPAIAGEHPRPYPWLRREASAARRAGGEFREGGLKVKK